VCHLQQGFSPLWIRPREHLTSQDTGLADTYMYSIRCWPHLIIARPRSAQLPLFMPSSSTIGLGGETSLALSASPGLVCIRRPEPAGQTGPRPADRAAARRTAPRTGCGTRREGSPGVPAQCARRPRSRAPGRPVGPFQLESRLQACPEEPCYRARTSRFGVWAATPWRRGWLFAGDVAGFPGDPPSGGGACSGCSAPGSPGEGIA
jgi:hypothetical protein